jgi:hypothetical protein
MKHSQGQVKDSRLYHIATQVSEMGAISEEYREIVEVCYSLDENE